MTDRVYEIFLDLEAARDCLGFNGWDQQGDHSILNVNFDKRLKGSEVGQGNPEGFG